MSFYDPFNNKHPLTKAELEQVIQQQKNNAQSEKAMEEIGEGISALFGLGIWMNLTNPKAHKLSSYIAVISTTGTALWLFQSGVHAWFWKLLGALLVGLISYALGLIAVISSLFIGAVWLIIWVLSKSGAFS